MSLKQRLATWKPGRLRKRTVVAGILAMCILFCGFTWTWLIEFTARVIFPFNDAIDTAMILQFEDYVDVDDLQVYLSDTVIAESVVNGIQANLSSNIYSNIELPEMREESLGQKIIRTIFDRLLE